MRERTVTDQTIAEVVVMKHLVIGIVVFVVVFFVVGISVDEMGMNGRDAETTGFIAGAIAFAVYFYKAKFGSMAPTEAVSETITKVREARDAVEARVEGSQAEFLALAEEEVDRGQIDKGLWAQALVKAKGNEELRKVEYMKLRARQLKREDA